MPPLTTEKILAISIIATFTLFLIFAFSCSTEAFDSKQDKSSAIIDWFNNTKDKTYTAYKKVLGADSNVVEFEESNRLFNNPPNFTQKNIEQVIN